MSRRFKLDENMPLGAATFLERHGYDVHTVFDEGLNGKPDRDIANACRQERRILITLDLDFSDIRVFPPDEFSGIMLFRPRLQSEPQIMNLLEASLSTLESEPIDGLLWVVAPDGIRIR